jgi:hypothetical protein
VKLNGFSSRAIIHEVRRKVHSLAEVLRKVLPPGSEKRIFSLELVQLRWTALVGKELALRSEPASLEDAVLTVRVSDAVWGRMILKLQRKILPRLRNVLGPDVVKRIRFVKDGKPLWESGLPPGASAASEEKELPTEVSAPILEAARNIEDSDLRSIVVKTASRYLRAQADRRR